MLVLSRKPGEEIVLPDCDVTVSVLGVSGSRVRLGITARADRPVHRREVWERIHGSPTADRSGEPSREDDESNRTSEGGESRDEDPACQPEKTPACLRPGQLVDLIRQRTDGRVHGLRVEADGERLIVHGRTASYYARQLVQTAVGDALRELSPVKAAQDVTYDIQVVWPQAPTPTGKRTDPTCAH